MCTGEKSGRVSRASVHSFRPPFPTLRETGVPDKKVVACGRKQSQVSLPAPYPMEHQTLVPPPMKKHLRIAALQCNFQSREKTLSMPEFWAEHGFNVEQLLHTHADLYSAIYDPERHKALMTEYLERSQACGLRTIVYMNCHILGPSLQEHFQDWSIQKKDGGQVLLYGTYPACCLNSGWRDYFFSCVESLGDFDWEGLFFDGPAYHDCSCPACQKKFLAETGKPLSQATQEEHRAFTRRSVLAFKEALRRKVKSVNPSWCMYFNEGLFSGTHDGVSMAAHLATNDLVGTEGGFFFYCEPKKLPFWRCAVYAKMAEAVAGDRPTVIFFAADHKPWGWVLHTPAELRLCYADAIGNGASVWLGIHSNPDNFQTQSGKAVLDMVKFDAEHDACYQNTHSLAEVAVLYSFNTASHSRNVPEESDFYGTGNANGDRPGNYYDAVQGAFALLEHLNLPYDIVTDLNPQALKRYRVLLAPNASCLDSQTLQACQNFVDHGGVLLADGQFAAFQEDGSPRNVIPPWLGIHRREGVVDQKRFNYLSLQWEGFQADNAFGYLPSPSWVIPVEPRPEAEILGRIPVPLAGCYAARPGIPTIPVAIRTGVGKGRLCLFSGGFFEFYYSFPHAALRRWGQTILKEQKLQYRLEGAPAGVSLTVRETDQGKLLVHLTNHVGVVRPLTAVPTLTGIALHTPEKWRQGRVLLGKGEKLSPTCPGCFPLPPLEEVTILLLES